LEYWIPYTRISEPNNEITWRQHRFVLFVQVLPPMGVIVLSTVLIVLGLVMSAREGGFSGWILSVPGLLGLLAGFGWYVWQYDGWRREVYRLTDTGIVDVASSPFGVRGEESTTGHFDTIQNINLKSPNIIWRALRMGDVTIDTAAQEAAFTFDRVHRPADVQRDIFERLAAYRDRQAQAEADRRYDELQEWMQIYNRKVHPEEWEHEFYRQV
jgi:uncharacterized membrane protein YdbT with pleckstrin-like domain